MAETTATPRTIIGGASAQLRSILPRPRDGGDDLELGLEAIILNVYVEPGWSRTPRTDYCFASDRQLTTTVIGIVTCF